MANIYLTSVYTLRFLIHTFGCRWSPPPRCPHNSCTSTALTARLFLPPEPLPCVFTVMMKDTTPPARDPGMPHSALLVQLTLHQFCPIGWEASQPWLRDQGSASKSECSLCLTLGCSLQKPHSPNLRLTALRCNF